MSSDKHNNQAKKTFGLKFYKADIPREYRSRYTFKAAKPKTPDYGGLLLGGSDAIPTIKLFP